ncbi:hypothetical protein Aph02nite_51000 [Actinoplanes philippinensis]|nr:hypothetical protein Aph02nite_51000 [Actinoplanes philippinensis]
MARRVAMAVILAMAAIAMWAATTKQITYIRTYGISMNPLYYEGDLVFVKKASSYEVGQVAAYHGVGGVQVLHRIIGGDGSRGFILKGDNNDSVDAINPTTEELIGRAVLHVPDGGLWLKPVLNPTTLGVIGFLFAGGGTTRVKSRRDLPRGHRKKKVRRMSGGGGGSWATAVAVFKAVSRLHPALRVLAVATALCGVLGLALGVLGWVKPTSETVNGTDGMGESMAFSYSAEVPRSAAYDGTTVYSPDPIFRSLTDAVTLHLNYKGSPGRIGASARLSSQNGWHTTIELTQPKQFSTDLFTDEIEIHLPSLDVRVADAAKAIGADMGAITLAITARVQHGDGTDFEPKVTFNLAPLQLTLAGAPETLIVNRSSTAAGTSVQDRRVGALGFYPLTAAEARKYAVYLVIVALIGAGIIAWMALGHVPLRTRAQIVRRYPHLIVPVEPMASPPGKPIVTVDTFPALVKLAEKYGQMILTWTRPDGADDFVVRDEGILYRYRIEPSAAAPGKPEPRPVGATPPVQVATETAPTPVLQLPPTPEPPPEVLIVGEEPVTAGRVPAKKAAPRKRASRAAAAKATATKTTATKRAPAKRAPARATSDPASGVKISPGTTLDEPTPLATEAVPEIAGSAADKAEHSDGPQPDPTPTPADDLPTPATGHEATAAKDQAPVATDEPERDQHPAAGTEQEPERQPDSEQVEPGSESGRVEMAPDAALGLESLSEAEKPHRVDAPAAAETHATRSAPEAPSDPEGPPAVDSAKAAPPRNQKRSSRRKARPRRATQPTMDEPPAATDEPALDTLTTASPAGEARQAMEDLAERNRPIEVPEPSRRRTESAAKDPEPDPNREPIYDFLPAAKRSPAPPDADEDA